jgi:hypothetical protein
MKAMKAETAKAWTAEQQDAQLGPCSEDEHKKKPFPCAICMHNTICDNCANINWNKKKPFCNLCKMSIDESNWDDNAEDEAEIRQFSPRAAGSFKVNRITIDKETGEI